MAGTSPAMTMIESTAALKSELRAAALARRDAIPAERRAAAAQAIAAHSLPIEMPKGLVVSGYAPIRSEIDPFPLMKNLGQLGLILALPVIVGRDQPLVFREWTIDTPLVRGPLGIFQPSADADEVEPDIAIVPLAAFDRAGHRIGYGAGHYDRTLDLLRSRKRIATVGVAFSVQQIDAVPAEPHDVRLDCVLTEREVIDTWRP